MAKHPGNMNYSVLLALIVFLTGTCGLLSAGIQNSGTESDIRYFSSDFDVILKQAKNLAIDQIRHKGRTTLLNEKNPQLALLWYRTALNRPADKMSDKELESLARIYSNMGHIYFYEFGNAYQAYPCLMKSLEICNANAAKPGFALTDLYYTFADIYSSYNDFAKTLHYLKKGFDVSLKKDIQKIGYSFANLVWFSILNDSVKTIGKERRQFLNAQAPDTSVLVQYGHYMLRAMDRIDAGDYGGAAKISDNALSDKTFATPDNPDITILRYQATARLISAHLYLKDGDKANAREKIAEAEKIITRNRLLDLYDIMYKESADYYRLTGNLTEARECEINAMKVRDSLFNSNKYGQIRNLEEEWKISEMEKRLGENENERKILLLKHNKQNSIMLIMSVSAAAIIFLLIRIFLKNRDLKNTNANLFRKNLELADALSSSAAKPIAPIQYMPDSAENGSVADAETKAEIFASPANGNPVVPESSKTAENEDSRKMMSATYEHIRQILSESKDIFDPDFNIESLSHLTGIHSRRISQAINSVTGKSFSSLIGEYRIAEACRQLTSPGIRPTIAAVAENVGYRSRTHFSSVFKTVTGMTTTEFIRQASRNMETKNR